jgi:class 3 adenylate cyclase/rubrerythrin
MNTGQERAVAPSGVVTFLFTDIEGSTQRWEADAEGMRAALAAHDAVLCAAIEAHGGWLFKHTGDGVCAAFASPRCAVDAAVAAQRALELPVRMGIATGEAELRGGDYFAAVLNRAARVMAAGHGGQILLAESTAVLLSGVDLVDLGPRRLRDLPTAVGVFQVRAAGLRTDFPALRALDSRPGNLRPAVTSFIGRESEVPAIEAAVRKHRLVTLTGVGGTVAFTTKRKAWWICSACGHKWEAAIGNRAAGAGCPVCAKATRVRNRGLSPTAAKARRKTTASVMPRPGTSFAERFPEAAAEWHPTRNDGLTPNQVGYASNRRAWWLCSTCGHEWSAIIQSRGRGGTGCPECGRRNSGIANAVPKPGRSLAERFPDLAAEWSERNHPLTPELVAAGSRRRVWWRCRACQHEWEAAVYSRASGHGCKQCAARASAKLYSAPKPGQSLADKHPELAAQWHPTRNNPLTPWDVTGTSGQKVWWRCEQGHEWEAFINNRHKAGCPKCKLWGTSAEEIRLRYELMAAGVPIDRSQEVRSATGKTLHCDMVASAWDVVIEFDGNRFHKTATGTEKDKRKTRLLTDSGWTVIRVRENLPPIGVNDVVVPLFSSELTRAKAVLEKLHDLGLKAPNHRRYMRSVEPWASAEASKHVERHPERSLATESPTLAAEWDTIKNGDLSPSNVTTGSGRKVWWLCRKCGHSWQAAVYSRARHGCPECGRSASTRTRSQRATTSRK